MDKSNSAATVMRLVSTHLTTIKSSRAAPEADSSTASVIATIYFAYVIYKFAVIETSISTVAINVNTRTNYFV